MELGTWADWVNAVGTYLAVGGAVVAARIGWKAYQADKARARDENNARAKDEQRREANERQSQASKVAFWIFRGRSRWSVRSINASGLPIYRLVMHVSSADPGFSIAIERGTHGPNQVDMNENLSNSLIDVLRRHGAIDMDPGKLKMAVAFTDCSDMRWLRDENGILQEVPVDFDFHEADERMVDRLAPVFIDPKKPRPSR